VTGVARRLLVDVRPLVESAAFRRLWLGGGLSAIGGQMTAFALALQVYTITRSPLAVGAVGLASALPALIFGLAGGSVADAVDRRRLVLVTSTGLALVSVALAAQAFAGLDRVWPLYGLVAAQSVLSSVDAPARRTFLARLLPPERVPAGAALNMLAFHGSVTLGPALAGLVAAAWGLRVCYLLDALSFVAALYGVARLPAMRPEPPAGADGPSGADGPAGADGPGRAGWHGVVDGLRYLGGRPVLVGALLTDINATVLGMPFALFPAINAARFGGSPGTLGLLSSAVAVGGVLGSLLSGPVGRVRRQGRAVLVASAVWGAALAGFGLAGGLWLALACLMLAGLADVVSVILRGTIIQLATPDRYRGRVSAVEHVVGAECPQLGNFRAGAVGSLTTPAVSAVSGGLAVVAGAVLIGLATPALTRYAAPAAPTGPEQAPEQATPTGPGPATPTGPTTPGPDDEPVVTLGG
jgi:MFS family permease